MATKKKASKKNRDKKEKSGRYDTEREIDYGRSIAFNQKLIFILIPICIVLVIINVLLETFTVKNVSVEGSEHYTPAQIRNIVQNRWFGDNTLYLSWVYSGNSLTNVPFIEKMDVRVLDRNSIKINVYEKQLAGYVEYLGTNVYFDKDGIVVESSRLRTAGIPLVTGLSFDHFEMYEQLPVEDRSVFEHILLITQLLNKYDINTDKIYFGNSGSITLYFGKVRVGLGTIDLVEEKIQRLDAILPSLQGLSGYLEMGNYEAGKDNFTFTQD